MSTVKWKRGDHKSDNRCLGRFWQSADGRWAIWQGRPTDEPRDFRYELEGPDGIRQRFRLLDEAKAAAQ